MERARVALLVGAALMGAGAALVGAALYVGLSYPDGCNMVPCGARPSGWSSLEQNIFSERVRTVAMLRAELWSGVIVFIVGMATVITFISSFESLEVNASRKRSEQVRNKPAFKPINRDPLEP